jgi:hypothetical protein
VFAGNPYPLAVNGSLWTLPLEFMCSITLVWQGGGRSDRLKREKRLLRQRYEAFHHPEIMQAYLRDPDSIQLPIPPLISEFRPRYDEWVAWAESELSFSRLVYHLSYRTFRRLRSFLANMSLR